MKDEFLLIKELLNKKNYKLTNQREIVLEVLIESNIHQNIKELYDKIKSHNKIGLATVYRTIY